MHNSNSNPKRNKNVNQTRTTDRTKGKTTKSSKKRKKNPARISMVFLKAAKRARKYTHTHTRRLNGRERTVFLSSFFVLADSLVIAKFIFGTPSPVNDTSRMHAATWILCTWLKIFFLAANPFCASTTIVRYCCIATVCDVFGSSIYLCVRKCGFDLTVSCEIEYEYFDNIIIVLDYCIWLQAIVCAWNMGWPIHSFDRILWWEILTRLFSTFSFFLFFFFSLIPIIHQETNTQYSVGRFTFRDSVISSTRNRGRKLSQMHLLKMSIISVIGCSLNPILCFSIHCSHNQTLKCFQRFHSIVRRFMRMSLSNATCHSTLHIRPEVFVSRHRYFFRFIFYF